jgi:histidine phosphotransferase ChpT
MEPSRLASYVASRICHDLAAPLTPLMQSCEMLFEDGMGPAMKAEGEKALKNAIATLEAKLRFLRFALGSQALNDGQANLHELRDLFHKLFAVNSKTELEWRMDTSRISNRQARVLMNMTLMMIDPATKCVCRVTTQEEGDELVLDVEAVGQFSNLKQEVQDALAGREPTGGWGGGAIQPYFTRTLAEEMGFTLVARTPPGAAGLNARGPISVS